MHPYVGAVRSDYFYALNIRFRYFLRSVIGVAHLIAAELALAANFTCSCHRAVLRKNKINVSGAYHTIRLHGLQAENEGFLYDLTLDILIGL